MKKLWMIACMALLLAACDKINDDPKDPDIAERTVMIYMIGDNNLTSYVQTDISELIQGAGDIPTNGVLVLYVDKKASEKPFIAKVTNNQKQPLDTLYKYTQEEFYDSDPNAFSSILQRMQQLCPAREYGLVLWGHASGWVVTSDTIAGKQSSPRRAYGLDTNNNNSNYWMNITQMAKALKTIKPHFIFADCCNMMCVEVGYELKDVTDYLIGSPAEIPGYGAPYKEMVPQLFKNGPALYKGIIDTYYDYYSDPTHISSEDKKTWPYMKSGEYSVPLSVIDTKYIGELAYRTHDILKDDSYPHYPEQPDLESIPFYYGYTTPLMYDMRASIQRLASSDDFKLWDAAFQNAVPYYRMSMKWMTIFNGFESYNLIAAFNKFDTSLKDECGCVSMFFPMLGNGYEYGVPHYPAYNNTSTNFIWNQVIDWKRFGW